MLKVNLKPGQEVSRLKSGQEVTWLKTRTGSKELSSVGLVQTSSSHQTCSHDDIAEK